MAYFTELSALSGINPILLGVIVVWTLAWKAVALWKAARSNHLIWFIVILVLNTAGIFPILYIFLFSKIGKTSKTGKSGAKKVSKKKK